MEEKKSRVATEIEAWVQSAAAIVAMLLALQFATGALLAFYYVPYTGLAHTTLSYIEKVAPAGSWVRALHHYGSQWLTLFLALHLTQMFWRATYRFQPGSWLTGVLLLAPVLMGGAAGYSLPWDVRALASTHVAEGITAGIPVVGSGIRQWLLGGQEISPLTLTRLFAIHVIVTPGLIMLILGARSLVRMYSVRPSSRVLPSPQSVNSEPKWRLFSAQTARSSIACGGMFGFLAFYCRRWPAPLGPPAGTFEPGYLPRPGAQFLWLFQLLKYLPGQAASIAAVALPALIFAGLLALPWIDRQPGGDPARSNRWTVIILFFAAVLMVTGLTGAAYIQDARDPALRVQLARQSAEEAAERSKPFTPVRVDADESGANQAGTGESVGSAMPNPSSDGNSGKVANASGPPESYLKNCAICHGDHGEGFGAFPKLIGVSNKPRRSMEDLIAITNDPASYGLRPPMKSFADKLTDAEKRGIAEWVMTLKKKSSR